MAPNGTALGAPARAEMASGLPDRYDSLSYDAGGVSPFAFGSPYMEGLGSDGDLASQANASAASLDAAQMDTSADGPGNSAASTAPQELPPLKVPFYELLIRQLQDDGFASEAQAISQQLNVQANTSVEPDALFESYGKSLRWAFGNEPEGAWQPMTCTPVPPIGQQEHVLDFDNLTVPTLAVTAAAQSAPGQPPPGIDVPPQAARKPPEIRTLYTASHKQACRSVSFSTDGRFCATGCTDGSIKILDCARMRVCAATTEGPQGRIRITEEELNRPVVRTLHDHFASITCLAFHPVNPTLFSGSLDKSVKIFDLTRPPGHKKAFSMLQDVYPVRAINIHPCGDFLLVGTAHPAVRVYDLQTLACFTAFHQDHQHSDGVNDIRCTSDGRMVASGSADGSIHFWDAVTMRVVNRLPRAHVGAAIHTLRWSRNLNHLLSSGADGRHRLWDLRKGKELLTMGLGSRSCDYSAAVLAAGEKYVVAANSNYKLADASLYDAQTGSPVYMKLGLHALAVRALDASPVDKTVMTGCDDEKARFFSLEDRTTT